jgi:hypothetical protein
MFQGGDAVREALLSYQEDELNNIKPTIEVLARLVDATRVRLCSWLNLRVSCSMACTAACPCFTDPSLTPRPPAPPPE